MQQDWKTIASLDTEPSRLARVCWPYDKYPDETQLRAGSSIVLLDADGPGVVTNIHSSDMRFLDDVMDSKSAREPDAYARVMMEITYDFHTVPDISVPLSAFFCDIDGRSDCYSTVYLSKVRYAHNFRLPIPFSRHIRIVLRNPTATDLFGYTDLQWKKTAALAGEIGYLRVAYSAGTVTVPEQTAVLCSLTGPGTVRAHWLALGTDLPEAYDGEYICEGNQEFYIDGASAPSLEYLGTEDVYSHSWGFAGTGGDGYAAIVRMDHPTPQRTEIAMLRCRTLDSIGFSHSLMVRLDYRDEFFAAASTNPLHRQGVFATRRRVSFPLDYRSCFYYYARPDCET